MIHPWLPIASEPYTYRMDNLWKEENKGGFGLPTFGRMSVGGVKYCYVHEKKMLNEELEKLYRKMSILDEKKVSMEITEIIGYNSDKK